MQTEIHRALMIVALALALVGCGERDLVSCRNSKIEITTSSEEARQAYLEGRDLLEAVRFPEAHRQFVAATELDPDFALAWLGVASTAATGADLLAALRHAVQAAQGASHGEQILVTAFEAGINGASDVQRAELERLVGAYPGDERAHNELGSLLLGLQEFDRAADQFRTAISINPEFAPAYNQLGYALRFCGDFEGARAAFQRYLELVPDQPNPHDSYGELLMKMGKFEESIDSYKKALEIEPSFTASYIGIANNLIFLDRPAEARRVLQRLASMATSTAEQRLSSSWTIATYLHEGDFAGALRVIERRLQTDDATDDRLAAARDHSMAGTILLAAGRYAEAEAAYERSLAMIERSQATEDIKASARRNAMADEARVALARGNLDRAERLIEQHRRAIAGRGDLFERQSAHELAGRLALAKGEPKQALFELAKANQQDPRVLMLNARAFAAAGDRAAARAACEEVIHFNQLSLPLSFVRKPASDLLLGLE